VRVFILFFSKSFWSQGEIKRVLTREERTLVFFGEKRILVFPRDERIFMFSGEEKILV